MWLWRSACTYKYTFRSDCMQQYSSYYTRQKGHSISEENSQCSTYAHVHVRIHVTVEPRLSGPPLSGTSIIRLGSFFKIRSENGRVPKMCMRGTAVTMETYLLILYACADNHVALLFINKVGGSRRGLSIQLSGIFTYRACFWNQGVRIIEVLL